MGKVVSELLRDTKLPKFFQVKQIFPRPVIPQSDISEYVVKQMKEADIAGQIRPGMRIAITAGSRGLANYVLILRYHRLISVRIKEQILLWYLLWEAIGGAVAERSNGHFEWVWCDRKISGLSYSFIYGSKNDWLYAGRKRGLY